MSAASLRALDRDGLDPWDVPAAPASQPPLDADEFERIKSEVFHGPWQDPQRFPDCMIVGLEALGDLAMKGSPEAAQALRWMVQRAVSGVPMNEPSGEDL